MVILRWEIPQAWFVSCSIVSTYSTKMTKLMLPLLAPQLQEKKWWRCSMVLLNGNSQSLVCFLCFLLNCVYKLHHNDQVNVPFASSSIARKTMVEMLYGAPQWEIPQAWFLHCSINSFFLSPQCIPCSKQSLDTCDGDA